MNNFEKFIYLISYRTTKESSYGIYHLVATIILIATTSFLCCFFKNSKDKTMRKILLIFWIVIVIFEIYKQLVFSFNYNGKTAKWDFPLSSFPFQLCSTQFYILPFIIFLKDCKFRDCMASYMSTFSLIGGLAVYIYPESVLTSIVGINIQTMTHHGVQVLLGIYLFVYNRKKANLSYFLKAVPVFLILTCMAVIMNEVVYKIIITKNLNESFNMFYISPYYPDYVEILKPFTHAVHPITFILGYIVVLIIGSFICYVIMKIIYELIKKIKIKLKRL